MMLDYVEKGAGLSDVGRVSIHHPQPTPLETNQSKFSDPWQENIGR